MAQIVRWYKPNAGLDDGRFVLRNAPEWWDDSQSALEKRRVLSLGATPTVVVYTVKGQQDHIFRFSDGLKPIWVWTRTDAEYLDLLTTRVQPFLDLKGYRPIITNED
ncbi:hypothetical protein RQ832_01950 [Roseomonas sp. DSM 102946]|nr:hypothetical protein [Roseomonas sp. DSM 102946]